MYKTASGKAQWAAGRIGPREMAAGEDRPRTLAEERADLLRVMKHLEGGAAEARKKRDHARARKLGRAIYAIQGRLTEIKQELSPPCARPLASFFVDVAYEALPPAQFKALMEAARRLRREKEESS